MASPLTFDFITDEELRASLESDYAELEACLANDAWKAAHVMSGSIIEAVLVDYLMSVEYSKKDPLKMSLEDLVSAGRSEGVLDEKAENLSTVIRGYRNLIHPGRVMRLKETVDEDGARVAERLVSMIVREVAAKQEQEFGLTAEQILAKFEADASVLPIADQLVGEMRPLQLERLLLSVLPERYFVLLQDSWIDEEGETLDRVIQLFHLAYGVAPAGVQKKVAKGFVSVLREEAGSRVEVYEDQFFRGTFLEHLTEPERKLVKDHLFARMKGGNLSSAQLESVEGLSKYIKPTEVNSLFDPLIRTISYTKTEELQERSASRIFDEYIAWLPPQLEGQLLARLDSWVSFHTDKDRTEAATRIADLRSSLSPADDDIPF